MENAEIRDAIAKAGLDLDSDPARGDLWIRWAKSGQPRRDWHLTSFDVLLLRFGDEISVRGEAGGTTSTPFDLVINIPAKTMVLKLSIDGRHHVWNFDPTHPRIRVLSSSNPEQLLIEFNTDFEFYGHYNMMGGSKFAVRANSP